MKTEYETAESTQDAVQFDGPAVTPPPEIPTPTPTPTPTPAVVDGEVPVVTPPAPIRTPEPTPTPTPTPDVKSETST